MCMSSPRKLSRRSSVLHASSSRYVVQSNLSSFLVVVWAQHPDIIPTEVGCSILELVELFVEVEPSLFIRASEVVEVVLRHFPRHRY
jgi:hypothetical protein